MGDEQLDIKLRAVLLDSVNQFKQLTDSATNFDKVITTTVKKIDSMGRVTGITQTVKNLDSAITQVSKYNDKYELISQTIKKTEKNRNTKKWIIWKHRKYSIIYQGRI